MIHLELIQTYEDRSGDQRDTLHCFVDRDRRVIMELRNNVPTGEDRTTSKVLFKEDVQELLGFLMMCVDRVEAKP